MADNALREWLDDLVQKHGLADDGDDPQQEYDQLGGDAALLKILAAEDKLFRTNLEKRRLEAMSVEARLERLRGGSAKTLEEARKKLDAEIEKLFKDSVAEDQAQAPYFDESSPDYELGAIDWEPVEKLLAKLESTSPDDLAKADPALAELQEKYDEKGGDEALFEKRVAAWKSTMGAFQMRNKIAADLAGADQLQERLTEARLALGRTEKELAELRAKERETLSRLRELTGGAESGNLLSGREASELQVLAREKKRLETEIANAEKLVPLRERSIENLGELIEKERRRHELQADDEAAPLPSMPRSRDIHELPLRAKYEELSAAS